MKKIIIAAFALASLAACGGSEQCSAFTAFQSSTKCESVQACCDGNSCKYVVTPSREFACDGQNCQSAATELVNYCM